MKPVIKKNKFYNLILMRDDSAAYSFRMSGVTLKILLSLFSLFTLCGAGGIAGGVYYWKKYRVVQHEHKQQEGELRQARTELDRLINFQSVMNAGNNDILQAKNEEVGVDAPVNRMHNATDTAEGDAIGILEHTDPIIPAVNATRTVETASTTPATQEENGSLLLSSPDSPLRINSFSLRVTGRQQVRITYDLSAARQDESRTLTGTTRYRAFHTNGTAADLTPLDNDGARFSIQRRKPMTLYAAPPQGQTTQGIERVEVLIDLSDGTAYHEIFDITQ